MHYQTLKKWIVGGLLFLLLVCAAVAFITIGKTAEAAAEINDAHNTEQNCEYELSNISNLSIYYGRTSCNACAALCKPAC